MNHPERFKAVIDFKPVDRLPHIEWAMWWDKTIQRWYSDGLPNTFKFNHVTEIGLYLGLDPYIQYWFSPASSGIDAAQHHGLNSVRTMDDYLKMRPNLYPDLSKNLSAMQPYAKMQEEGNMVVWNTYEGFYWFPRTLMDIEGLSYAYFDEPELVHKINQDVLDFNSNLLKNVLKVCKPTFVTIAEDMSYNNGPLVSKDIFDEFMLPYYKQFIALLKENDIRCIVDTDGDVTMMVQWLLDAGANGVLPLERQAGVDGNVIRKNHPDLCMIGHFNKLVMHLGEGAIRAEFDRLIPLMKSGGFIPSVDHQTPPNVSLEEYKLFVKILKEYCAKYHL